MMLSVFTFAPFVFVFRVGGSRDDRRPRGR